jgi:hypothetical protein
MTASSASTEGTSTRGLLISITLPPSPLHKLNDKSEENNEPVKKGKCKGASNGNKEEQRNSQTKPSKITNTNQVEEFKMAEGKTWEGTFQGKCPDKRVKWMGSFVCPQYHTSKGECWAKGYKYRKTHLPASAVPQNVKTEYLGYGMLQDDGR